ncbi:MAG: hypothetical protein KC656_12910, partial [Myxococcales bacterium]|nr:hypothetical protein [Myxococcales bacterium]
MTSPVEPAAIEAAWMLAPRSGESILRRRVEGVADPRASWALLDDALDPTFRATAADRRFQVPIQGPL